MDSFKKEVQYKDIVRDRDKEDENLQDMDNETYEYIFLCLFFSNNHELK